MDFSPFQAVLLDLDGTIYHEDHPLPGALELVNRLQREGKPFACLTNSTTSPQRLHQRLLRMQMDVEPARIYTAAAAAVDYVLDRFGRGSRVFNLSTDGIEEMLQGQVQWVQAIGEPCDVVIAGVPANVYATEDRQRIALALLRAGAALVGICADRVYPSPRGIEFGSGAFCSMLGYASNTLPTYCGKPNAVFFHKLCERLNVDPRRCLLIGDNLETDILGAKGVGMKTVLTCTGITCRADLPKSAVQPDSVIADLRELL